ncbi:2-phosphosulfolactate phosphatase [Pseudonocardia nigra]|uniref:2-phosphosulfolactate phosphatase n=1 Tax=Pseudonocardia nigra TaxID=1921578 RepID=UPI0027E2253A|nr:2-phosphosulfolactate phosphatase [Pseudonocardia nigra]
MPVDARPEHRQRRHEIRLEWGPEGAALLAAKCAVVIVVDVLSFSTAVDIAVGRGAAILPQRRVGRADRAAEEAEARALGVQPAGPRGGTRPSLRPSSLMELPAGTRLALPSPNGATLCAAVAGNGPVLFAGCLRNASAVAAAARAIEGPVGLVSAGERWPGGTLRVAIEDAIGAGAIAAALPAADRSPEAEQAVAQFAAARDRGLADVLAACASRQELIADGYGADVTLAAALDASTAAPRWRDGLLQAG